MIESNFSHSGSHRTIFRRRIIPESQDFRWKTSPSSNTDITFFWAFRSHGGTEESKSGMTMSEVLLKPKRRLGDPAFFKKTPNSCRNLIFFFLWIMIYPKNMNLNIRNSQFWDLTIKTGIAVGKTMSWLPFQSWMVYDVLFPLVGWWK